MIEEVGEIQGAASQDGPGGLKIEDRFERRRVRRLKIRQVQHDGRCRAFADRPELPGTYVGEPAADPENRPVILSAELDAEAHG